MADAATLQRTLDDLVQRIARAVHPRRIIVFGSAARGGWGRTVTWMSSSSCRTGSIGGTAQIAFIAASRGLGPPKTFRRNRTRCPGTR